MSDPVFRQSRFFRLPNTDGRTFATRAFAFSEKKNRTKTNEHRMNKADIFTFLVIPYLHTVSTYHL